MSESANEGHFGDEVTLLISSAKAKNIDVSVWLTEGGNDGKIIFPDFSSKLISLGLIVAMGEDGDNKSKLDYATSEVSLKSILKICQKGQDSLGMALIDVTLFLQIVDKNQLLNTRTQFSDDMVGVRTSLSDYPLNDSVELHYTDTDKCTSNDDRYSTRIVGDDRYDNADIKIAVDNNFSIQDDNLSGKGTGSEGGEVNGDRYSQEYFEELKNANQWRPQANTTPGPGPGPPSMAALFDADDKHEPISPIEKKESDASIAATLPKKKPKAIASNQRITPSSSASEPRRSSTPGPVTSSASVPRRSSTSGSGVARSASRTPTVRSSKLNTGNPDLLSTRNPDNEYSKEELLELQVRDQRALVEDHVRNAVRQTDLYHLIQVHLGFIDSYTMIPPRGVVVSSKPRPWLTVRDIQTAFMAGRVRLNDLQVYAFSELVNLFSKEYKDAHKNQPILDLSTIEDLNADKDTEDEAVMLPQRSLSPDPSARSNTPTKRDLSCPAHQLPITALPKHALAPGHKINAEWLKRYLVHLRLTKRPSNLAADNRAATASTVFASQTITRSRRSLSTSGSGSKSMDCSRSSTQSGADRRSLDNDEQRPVPWLDWLSEKVKNDRNMSEGKPKEFRRALTGKPHSLSKPDLNRILEGNEIIPEKILHAEVIHRAHSWVLDTSGRRDFSHLLNIEMRKWEMKRKMEMKLQVERGEKTSPITKEERESAKSDIKKDLIALKTTELLSAERTHVFITKELFWKYDGVCRDNNYAGTVTWGVWLEKYRLNCTRQLKKFQENNRERDLVDAARVARRHSVAGLNEIEMKLSEAAKSLSTFHGVELKKSLVALRKSAMSHNTGHQKRGTLISKEEFDFHLESILAPRMNQLPDSVKALAIDIRNSYEDLLLKKTTNENDKKINISPTIKSETEEYDQEFEPDKDSVEEKTSTKKIDKFSDFEKDDEIFSWNEERAVKRVLELRDENELKKKEEFSRWKDKKIAEIKERERMEQLEREKEEKDKIKKEKEGKKAYKKWLRLRKSNRYVSKADGKKHTIPVGTTVSHYVPWNKEMDLKDYYTEMDRQFF